MKDRKILIFSLIAAFVLVIGLIGYFINGISAVYPSIKTYEFSFTKAELTNKIKKIDEADEYLNLKFKDTTGAGNDRNYYADVYLKTDTTSYIFSFYYNEKNKTHSSIKLVGAFDSTHHIGGYVKDEKDMTKLIRVFESNFIERISKFN